MSAASPTVSVAASHQAGRARRVGATPWLLSLPALILFFAMLVVPMALTAVLSFNAFDANTGVKAGTFTLGQFERVLTDPYYYQIFGRTFGISLVVSVLCLVIGVPEAYILSRMSAPWRSILLVVVLAPLLVSVIVRAFGWTMLLGPGGLIDRLSLALGLGRVHLLYTQSAIVIALVHVMLPFMIIPVWTALQKLDTSVENAALSLGASHWTAWRRVIFPQVLPGMLSGSLIVFGLSASAFAIPVLLGGLRLKMAATLVYDQYLNELNWPLGAAIAFLLLAANLVIMLGFNRTVERHYRRRLG